MFTNNLVMFSFRSLTEILVGDQLQQRSFEAFHVVIPEPEHQDHTQHSLESSSEFWSFGSSRLGDGALQEDLGILVQFVLDPCVKIRQCDMLKFTIHTRFMFWSRFSVFGLTDIGFHEQIVYQNKFKWFMYCRFILYTCILNFLDKLILICLFMRFGVLVFLTKHIF